MSDLHTRVLLERETLIESRRWLHQHAELSWKECETTDYIERHLQDMGGNLILSRPTPTSVMAVLKTGRPGRTVAIRADIDALPIQEENELEYRSIHKGVMHACGHDGHTAILLSAVRLLTEQPDLLCGELRFIFQHAEEVPPGGAVEVIAAGVLDGVDEVYGLHLTSILPTGQFGVCPGVLTSSTDRFDVCIQGKGGHSSMPQECVDPIVTGAELICALQTIVSRSIAPSDAAVLSVCRAEGGSAYNVIPNSFTITGSVRTYDEKVRTRIQERIETLAKGIAAAHGAKAEFTYSRGYDSIVNDTALTQMGRNLIAQTFGESHVTDLSPIAPGDDFCYYSQKCPGFFVELGAANSKLGSDAPHHNPRYRMDEDALVYGLEYTVALLRARCSQ
ncbi:M20 family metallopeptidase [uncultured Ruthenibacterium sp.]|uniref:M20 metallopeptidase family protein n=1 Tax=uncultured Ruthenibacterium sp. TaxID=1905347 RepID=UPI00349EB7A3